jgi:hypothetical protein
MSGMKLVKSQITKYKSPARHAWLGIASRQINLKFQIFKFLTFKILYLELEACLCFAIWNL